METNPSFEKMANALNSEYKPENEDVKEQYEIIESKKNELVEVTEKNEISLQDKEFLQNSLKDLIKSNNDLLTLLRDDIKIGANPRQVEVYAKFNDSVTNQLKELKELNKTIMDTEVLQDNISPDNNKGGDVNIQMSGKEMLEFYKEFKKENSLDKVDAEFEVEEEVR